MSQNEKVPDHLGSVGEPERMRSGIIGSPTKLPRYVVLVLFRKSRMRTPVPRARITP